MNKNSFGMWQSAKCWQLTCTLTSQIRDMPNPPKFFHIHVTEIREREDELHERFFTFWSEKFSHMTNGAFKRDGGIKVLCWIRSIFHMQMIFHLSGYATWGNANICGKVEISQNLTTDNFLENLTDIWAYFQSSGFNFWTSKHRISNFNKFAEIQQVIEFRWFSFEKIVSTGHIIRIFFLRTQNRCCTGVYTIIIYVESSRAPLWWFQVNSFVTWFQNVQFKLPTQIAIKFFSSSFMKSNSSVFFLNWKLCNQ